MPRPGETVRGMFPVLNAAGVPTAPTAGPTFTVYRNGAADGTAIPTVTNPTTGVYSFSLVVPATYAAGDEVSLFAAATVGGVAVGPVLIEEWTLDAGVSLAGGPVLTPAGYLYCGPADVAARLSELGVELRTDDDQDVIGDPIAEASAQIDAHLLPLYPAAQVAPVRWVRFCCRALAVYYLCLRRNEPPPAAAQAEYESYMAQLASYATGERPLVAAAQAPGGVRVSNQSYDLGRYPQLRVERPRSTPALPPARRRIDPRADSINGG